MAGTTEQIKAIKEHFPEIDWPRFEDIDRSLNFDLWYGTASEYFGEDKAEPLEHYEWNGYIQAEADIRELLDTIPWEMWFDGDSGYVTTSDPNDDEGNWLYHCKYCDEFIRCETNYLEGKRIETWIDDIDGNCCHGNDELENEGEPHEPNYNREAVWCGGEEWTVINPRQVLMYVESFKQVF